METERTAPGVAALEPQAERRRGPLRSLLANRELMRAGGLAAAFMAQNGIQLVFMVIAARLLGASSYGSLARLVSLFLILSVAGQAIQVATAREVAGERLGGGGALASTVRRWLARLIWITVAVALVSALLREPIAALVSVDQEWAAATALPMGCVWLLLSIERGALQGLREYGAAGWSIVLEAFGRLVLGVGLIAAGGGVTGAYLGMALAIVGTAAVLDVVLHRKLGRPARERHVQTLRRLFAGAWAPIAGLTLVFFLQNVDVIVVGHVMGGDEAGDYAVAAQAARAVFWLAVGIGLYVVPEATRRALDEKDPRPILGRGLTLLIAAAIPALAIFVLAPELVLRLAFGSDLTGGADALAILGGAMTALAVTYLAVQYLLALHRFGFLAVLAAVAVAEVVALLALGLESLAEFSVVVLAAQACAAGGVLAWALATRRGRALAAPIVP